MTAEYHKSRGRLIEAMGDWWKTVEEHNRLGAMLLQGVADQFAKMAGTLEREIFETCPKCSVTLAPDGACENKRCRELGEGTTPSGGVQGISN
jgi:hypothetical protein